MEQIKFGVRAQVKGSFVNDDIFEQTRPTPVLSLSFPHCIESGKDYMWGGAEFNCGDGCMFVGLADLVNSLYAVKHLVFDEKKLTMAQMIDACKANFEGYEDIYKICKDAPKYGNDIPEVDHVCSYMCTKMADYIESFKSHYGKFTTGIIPVLRIPHSDGERWHCLPVVRRECLWAMASDRTPVQISTVLPPS